MNFHANIGIYRFKKLSKMFWLPRTTVILYHLGVLHQRQIKMNIKNIIMSNIYTLVLVICINY